jgi:hypothetical protein
MKRASNFSMNKNHIRDLGIVLEGRAHSLSLE